MSNARLVDTNLIVRHLVQDHAEHAKAAGKLFEACDRGDIKLLVLSPVLAESVFVLESFYKHPRPSIADALTKLIASPGVEIINPDIHADALSRFGATKVHFVDCLIAATAAASEVSIASFDQDFKKFRDVKVNVRE